MLSKNNRYITSDEEIFLQISLFMFLHRDRAIIYVYLLLDIGILEIDIQ